MEGYIPVADLACQAWADNFAAKITAAPTDYGLVSGDAVTIQGLVDAFDASLLAALDPTTRSPTTVIQKDNDKVAMLEICRPYAQNIRNNAAVSDALKIGLGLTVPSLTPTPIPAVGGTPAIAFLSAGPLTHLLTYGDPEHPRVKAKPFGAIACELQIQYVAIDAEPTEAGWRNYGNVTKTPFVVNLDPTQQGKDAVYRGRWINRGTSPGGQFAVVGSWGGETFATVLAA